jgi:uncharacterized membrane protein YadS
MAEEESGNQEFVETEHPEKRESGWKELVTKEDYWAVWLGFLLIVVALFIFLPRAPEGMEAAINASNAVMEEESTAAPFKTLAWYEAHDVKQGIKASSEPHGKAIARFTAKPHGWNRNPVDAFIITEAQAEEKKAAAEEKFKVRMNEAMTLKTAAGIAETSARTAGFQNDELNEKAGEGIAAWRNAKFQESKAKKKTKVTAVNQIPYLAGLCAVLGLFFGVGIRFMGGSFMKFFVGFIFVFALAVLAQLCASQSLMKEFGIGYPAWGILFGMLISNTIGTPKWIMPAVQTEFFIKTGLVLLGAEILFGKILTIGVPGIFVAWVVTPIVLISTYLFGQYVLKITSKTLNITISADMSVCGVSAAIAVAAACRAKKEELTLAVGLSLIFTSVMMIVMPAIIKGTGMPFILGGAWMGGTIDATGAVAAAGAFLSDKALYVAATIKMIQNVLIGVVAFGVALYWCFKVDRVPGVRVGKMEIWYRFPKFVLGFIVASIIFSVIYEVMGSDAGYTLVDQGVIRGFTKIFRGWFFCLAFVSIGLATNFRELAHYFKGGKPLILYICGQTFNLCLTLFMAWIMFYKIFPFITEKI